MTDREIDTGAIQAEFYVSAKTQLDIITLTLERIRNDVSTVPEWAALVDLLSDQVSLLRNQVWKRILLNNISTVKLKPEYTTKKGE